MALVGDCLMAMRAAIPDPPATLSPPANFAAASANVATGTLIPGTTFRLIATALNPWGETIGSNELTVTIAAGNNSITGTCVLPPGANGGRAYYTAPGGAAGDEVQYVTISLAGAFTILSPLGGLPGAVPEQNSAWNPDTDGGYISCGLAYKWLNDGLTTVGTAAGGIEDTTGVATIAQQLYYQIPGRWIRFNTARYDQWPVVLGDRDYIQYRYNVSGVVSLVATEAVSQALGVVFSAYPEPGASSATTALSVDLTATAVALTCVDASLFTPMSRIQIDNEIMMFSQVNGTGVVPGFINGLIRGVAGTTPVAHTAGATITELKFNFTGFRLPQLYTPGSALLTLDAQNAWEVALNWYMLARSKEKEQALDEADKLDSKFANFCNELKKDQANPITVSQIGGTLNRGRDVGRGRIIIN